MIGGFGGVKSVRHSSGGQCSTLHSLLVLASLVGIGGTRDAHDSSLSNLAGWNETGSPDIASFDLSLDYMDRLYVLQEAR